MKVLCLYHPAGILTPALHGLGEACLRLSSQVALREGEAVFVEAGGSRMLFGDEALRARLLALGRRFPGLAAPRLGAGRDAGEALALARFGGTEADALPLEALACYASPFRHDEAVDAMLLPMVAGLKALGLKSLADLRALPAGGMGERFGHDAAALRERIAGRFPMAWPRFEPAEQMEEIQDLRSVETGEAFRSGEAVAFHLKALCDRVASRLRGRGLRAAGLELSLHFESVPRQLDLAAWRLAVALPLPQAAPLQLRKLLGERLEAELQRRRLPRPLTGLGVRISATAPGFHPQRDAFDSHEEEVEALNGLLVRLGQRLGEEHVFYAELLQRYLPEQAWRKALGRDALKPAAAAVTAGLDLPRPTRLLKRPLLLTRVADQLIYWGGGSKTRRWRAQDWQGPERICLPWWQPALPVGSAGAIDTPARDYWRVHTAEGTDLWVFSRQGDEARGGALWLQGFWA